VAGPRLCPLDELGQAVWEVGEVGGEYYQYYQYFNTPLSTFVFS